MLLPVGLVPVVRLGLAVARAGRGGPQRLVVDSGLLLESMALVARVCSQIRLVVLNCCFW